MSLERTKALKKALYKLLQQNEAQVVSFRLVSGEQVVGMLSADRHWEDPDIGDYSSNQLFSLKKPAGFVMQQNQVGFFPFLPNGTNQEDPQFLFSSITAVSPISDKLVEIYLETVGERKIQKADANVTKLVTENGSPLK